MAGSPSKSQRRLHEASRDNSDNAYEIPALRARDQSLSSSHTSRRVNSPALQGRSMSNTFPTLFNSKKKRDGSKAPDGFNSKLEDRSSSSISPSQKIARPHEKELITGKCMTCDSTVRWPRGLDVYRCPVCMTINDLKPKVNDHDRSTDDKLNLEEAARTSEILLLSKDETSELARECITSYLLNRLSHEANKSPETSMKRRSVRTEGSQQRASPFVVDDMESMNNPDGNTVACQIIRRGPSGEEFGQNGSNLLRFDEELDSDPAFCAVMSPISSTPGLEANERVYIESRPLLSTERVTPHSKVLGSSSHATRAVDSAMFEDVAVSSAHIFKTLEDYIVARFLSHGCVNSSFSTHRLGRSVPATSEIAEGSEGNRSYVKHSPDKGILSPMDAKALLIGDFAENGSWWIGDRSPVKAAQSGRLRRNQTFKQHQAILLETANLKTPKIDWDELSEWYQAVLYPGLKWKQCLDDLFEMPSKPGLLVRPTANQVHQIESEILEAEAQVRRLLLKATESLLKRPSSPLRHPADIRFLLIILANPILYPAYSSDRGSPLRSNSSTVQAPQNATEQSKSLWPPERHQKYDAHGRRNGPGHHSGIIKRVLGLLSNLPNDCHHYLVNWFARYSEDRFQKTAELIGSFVTYRLTRQHIRGGNAEHDPTAGLVPSLAPFRQTSSAALQAALGRSGRSSDALGEQAKRVVYHDDWQIRAAARVMALLFSANNVGYIKHLDLPQSLPYVAHTNIAGKERAHRHGQILATSDFYNTLLDYSDLIADFEAWESRRGKFAFCQYPFFLSIWAKIQIMEHDARRQMEIKAREAFFDSIMTRKVVNQYLVLKVRRECLVEDSLKSVSEVVGIGGEEIKKGLRIEFKGEEGIDAGGLRKEWFLLLVREVFNPEHGMFNYDEESRCCYFNPNSFETSDQFFLVGVVLGLAIYNSTILDIALPSFAYRKLLAASPTLANGAPSHAKPSMVYTLTDLAEYRPALAHGLRQLLLYDGDVQETFCRDFVIDVDRYGQTVQVPLCPNGQDRPVTNFNRAEFVDLYVCYLLDIAVTRQFEPFKRGFFTVCGGNALSLFRPEEIELLIRGSDDLLDIRSLRVVSTYENWGVFNPAETEPVIGWFWNTFEGASSTDQRKLLTFITGSDRIPATGVANLVIKLSCLGDDCARFPVARTCFNMLSLWRYNSRDKLELMLWRAVNESEGFGLK